MLLPVQLVVQVQHIKDLMVEVLALCPDLKEILHIMLKALKAMLLPVQLVVQVQHIKDLMVEVLVLRPVLKEILHIMLKALKAMLLPVQLVMDMVNNIMTHYQPAFLKVKYLLVKKICIF
jgi:hypothetical protein